MSEFKNLPSGWSRYELGEICKISSSKFDPTKNSEVKKCIELEHLSQKTGQILGFISSSEQKSIKNEFKTGQILYGKLRPYLQKFCQAKFDGVCSSEIWVLQGKKVTNDFLFYLVQSDKFNQIANKTSGTKMPRADWEYMSEMPFFIPPELEQEKIAEILSTWDEAINLTINLIENKKQFKKALMQNLLTAKIRFPEFKDEWREDKLAKNVKIQCGYSFESKDFKKQGIPIIRISNISNTSIYMNMTDLVYFDEIQNEKKFLIKKNDLLIAMSGATAGKVSIYDLEQKAYLNQRVGLFRVTSPLLVNYGFLTQFVFSNFFSKQLILLLSTSAQPNISSKDIENLKIKLPNLKEQQKIAEVLTACDDEINLLNLKLENLKKQKQGLMQKLLSGKLKTKVKGGENVKMGN